MAFQASIRSGVGAQLEVGEVKPAAGIGMAQ
jgi:hypothetical protein